LMTSEQAKRKLKPRECVGISTVNVLLIGNVEMFED